TLLRSHALIWWRRQREEAKEGRGQPRIMTEWEEFAKAITSHFYPIDSSRWARDQMNNLVQRGSVSEYVAKFNQLLSQVHDMSEGERIERFERGLKPHVKNLIAVGGPQSLSESIQIALRLDSTQDPMRPMSPRYPSTRATLGPEQKYHLRAQGRCFY